MLAPERDLEYTEPLLEEAGLDVFFRGGHWGQCLELLSHLCQYSDSILLITGPSGIGKSTLKNALVQAEAENFSFCEIQVTTNLTAENLISKIDARFEKPINNDLVLLLENAENLSVDVMMALLQLKQRLGTQRHMQVILFASPDLEQKIRQSVIKEEFAEQVHTIEIEPLTVPEVESFLNHQWRLSGQPGILPFNKVVCKKIHSMSGGIPSKVQQLARDYVSKNRTPRSQEKSKGLPPMLVGFIVLAGLLFCLLAFLWPEADDSLIANTKTAQATPKIDILQEPLQDQQIVGKNESADDEQLSIAEERAKEEEIARLEQKVIALQKLLTEEQVARRNAEVKAQTVKAQPLKTNKTVEKPTKTVKIGSEYTKDEKYILSLPEKNYSLQLLGASNEARVKEFIKINNLGTQARYFKSTYQGKPWFIIVYGNYTSRSLALSAIDKLPASVKKLQPWPREYSYIQRTIKKN